VAKAGLVAIGLPGRFVVSGSVRQARIDGRDRSCRDLADIQIGRHDLVSAMRASGLALRYDEWRHPDGCNICPAYDLPGRVLISCGTLPLRDRPRCRGKHGVAGQLCRLNWTSRRNKC
jgi:hypothetical protein